MGMRAYRSGLNQVRIAEALEPPVHWLTIQDALGQQGWVNRTQRVPPWSTATKEGEAEARKHADKFTLDSDFVWGAERYAPA